jgi:transcriptional regulator with XRE-family HTH domain
MRVSAISEPSAGRDDQLGQIFLNMRKAMNVSRETIARRLATRASTIDDFEAGAVAALPHWKETQRIVRGYCQLLRLDPEPILWRIRSQLDALSNPVRPPMQAPRGPMPLPASPTGRPNGVPASLARERTRTERPEGEGRRRGVRTLFALTLPAALLAGVVYAAQTVPQYVYPAIAMLPDRVEVPVRAGLEYMLLLTAPSRDGLRWIEVGDPRVRKADKLQTGSP